MSESSEVPLNIKESAQTTEPKFLQRMRKDNPELAGKITERIDNWTHNLDEAEGIAGLGEAIISHMEYIDKEEFDEFIDSITAEVEEILDNDPLQKINFVTRLKNKGSGPFFYNQVKDRVDPKYKESLRLIDTHTPEDYLEDGKRTVYFYLDDSSNSGQQLKQGVFAFRTFSDINESTSKYLAEYPIDYRIRFMRITDYMRKFVEDPDRGQQRFMVDSEGNVLVQLDLNSNKSANKRMPIINDVMNDLGIDFKDLKVPFWIQQSHAGRTPATLAIFWHKIQDNMPIVILGGGIQTGFDPLITREDENNYPKPYKSN